MSKTLNLISKYFRILSEQTPEEQIGAAPGAVPPSDPSLPPAPEPEQQESTELDENEKYVIKILTNSFIFNPKLFDKNKQKYIFSKIEQISKMVNVPVSKMVQEIKKIIALDKSLKVESKTLRLIKSYTLLIEQGLDATEPQTGGSPDSAKQDPTEPPKGLDDNKLNLSEIFPLYKELIIKALKHIPTEEELMILKPVVNEFADIDPEKIVEVIQNILSQSLEDKEVEDSLSNA